MLEFEREVISQGWAQLGHFFEIEFRIQPEPSDEHRVIIQRPSHRPESSLLGPIIWRFELGNEDFGGNIVPDPLPLGVQAVHDPIHKKSGQEAGTSGDQENHSRFFSFLIPGPNDKPKGQGH